MVSTELCWSARRESWLICWPRKKADHKSNANSNDEAALIAEAEYILNHADEFVPVEEAETIGA